MDSAESPRVDGNAPGGELMRTDSDDATDGGHRDGMSTFGVSSAADSAEDSAWTDRPADVTRRQGHPRARLLHLVLFLATCGTTWMIGGPVYAACLMGLLLAHEMGHYLQSVRYGIPATLPFFIPVPFPPFGTMGAVILQGAGVADRKKLFDIAISGPLAGLVIALPITYIGLQDSQIIRIDEQIGGMVFGNPLILQWMIESIHGPLGPNEDVSMGPMLFAGWVGIFITALNLMPIGQLDGGHIMYALLRKQAHGVAMLLLGGAVAYMAYSDNYSYLLIVVLLLIMGPRHPPTADDYAKLGLVRVVLGWLTLGFVIIGLTPTPLVFMQPDEGQRQSPEFQRGPDDLVVQAGIDSLRDSLPTVDHPGGL